MFDHGFPCAVTRRVQQISSGEQLTLRADILRSTKDATGNLGDAARGMRFGDHSPLKAAIQHHWEGWDQDMPSPRCSSESRASRTHVLRRVARRRRTLRRSTLTGQRLPDELADLQRALLRSNCIAVRAAADENLLAQAAELPNLDRRS